MADIVSRSKRSEMMSGIRGRDTKPEMLIRRGLHKEGFRFRLYREGLPGRPDLVFPRYRAILFVHGCFWHKHECHLFKMPSSRSEFWSQKLARNVEVDARNVARLRELGWRVGIIWECALKGKGKYSVETVITECRGWILSEKGYLEVKGQK